MTPEQKIPKPVKERDDLDLLNLLCELSGRFAMYQTKSLHEAYVEARTEMETRIAGRSAGLERVKELEDGLRNLRHGLFSDVKSVNDYIDNLLK